jgi:hypothetical protein
MTTGAKVETESVQPAGHTCLGFILRGLRVWVPKRMIPHLGALSVVSIRVKQSQFPPAPGATWRTGAVWCCTNKANSRRCRVDRGPRDGGRRAPPASFAPPVVQTNPISGDQAARGQPIAPNKANWAGSVMQHEANLWRRRLGQGHRGAGRGAIARNKPNFGRSCRVLLPCPSPLRPRVSPGAVVQTNPICTGAI